MSWCLHWRVCERELWRGGWCGSLERAFGKALLIRAGECVLFDFLPTRMCVCGCVPGLVLWSIPPLPGSLPSLEVSMGLPASLLSGCMEKLQVEH